MGDADPAVFEVVMDIDDADAENDEQQVHYPWDVCIGECHVLALSGYDLPLSVFGNMTQEETDEAEEGDCCGCSATKVKLMKQQLAFIAENTSSPGNKKGKKENKNFVTKCFEEFLSTSSAVLFNSRFSTPPCDAGRTSSFSSRWRKPRRPSQAHGHAKSDSLRA